MISNIFDRFIVYFHKGKKPHARHDWSFIN